MSDISVIIPVYNRRDHLYLCLCALEACGTHYREPMEVIVTDDGSEDDPLSALLEFRNNWQMRYLWHPHDRFQACKTINRACEVASGDSFFILGSDILLERTSLSHLANIHKGHPAAIIAGRYDWMLPMQIRPYDVYHNFAKIIEGTLPPKTLGKNPVGIIGKDPRYRQNPSVFDAPPQSNFACALFADALLIPRTVFEALGGFDEAMIGHGGQDAEFSIRAQMAGYKAIFSNLVHGYHMYHTRDQSANLQTGIANIEYIAKKHDLAKLGLEMWADGENRGIGIKGGAVPRNVPV